MESQFPSPPRAALHAPETVVIGTAGHIDHGKTALIRALTGVDTDRLPEEKQRGITIDLGFASLNLDEAGERTQISFIDVPGHARFIRNMLAGTGSIDSVMLVISAEEGVKPQTEEHLAICAILGIERGLTVLTKTDAVDQERLNEVRSSVERFLATTFLASEPIVCASAITGSGLEELRRELGALARRIPVRSSGCVTRIPLDRAFTVKGFGTVATGTLIAGSVAAGQELSIEPGARRTRVRGLQVHGRQAMSASAAIRVALNLSRIEHASLHRGDTLVEPYTLAAAEIIDVEISLLAGAPALRHRARVHFHAFASESMASLSLYEASSLEPGKTGLARLRISTPIVLAPGDRFVLRQSSPNTTIGGGRVLDAHPLPRGKRRSTQEWLQRMNRASPAEQLVLRVERRGLEGISLSALTVETGLTAEAIRALLAPKEKGPVAALENSFLLAAEALAEAVRMAGREFQALLAQSGEDSIKRSALQSRMRLPQEVLDRVLQVLAREGTLRIAGDLLLSPATDSRGADRDQERLAAICAAYERAGLAPPSTGEIAATLALDAAEMRRLVAALLREKKLVRLGGESLLAHPAALAHLKERMQSLRGQSLDVGRFKELTGLSRKFAVPLLEYLDRERVTRKDGDRRIVL